MNDIRANKNVCLKFFELNSTGKYAEAMQLIHENVEWWVNGDLPTSGTYRGREAVTELFKLLADYFPTGLKLNLTAVTAEEDRVAIEMNSDGVLPNGRDYRNTYHMLFWVRDGFIVKTHEYFDTKYTAEVLSA
jgi:ketosteroid isomerase-like protein